MSFLYVLQVLVVCNSPSLSHYLFWSVDLGIALRICTNNRRTLTALSLWSGQGFSHALFINVLNCWCLLIDYLVYVLMIHKPLLFMWRSLPICSFLFAMLDQWMQYLWTQVWGKELAKIKALERMARRQTFWLHLLFLACWTSFGEAEYMKYKDPKQSINVRIKDLMDRMTLAEKIGQMTQIERKVASAQVMKDYFIGKVSAFSFISFFSKIFLIIYLEIYWIDYVSQVVCWVAGGVCLVLKQVLQTG